MVEYRDILAKSHPILSFLKRRSRYANHFLKRGEIVSPSTFLPYSITNFDFFSAYLEFKANDEGLLEVTTYDGHNMLVRYDDDGIGYELYITGTHEYHASETYREELRTIGDQVEEPTVFEIGSNIGYFTLMTIGELPDSTVYATEPIPANVNILEKNLELNSVSEQVDVTRGAISNRDGTTEIHLSTSSNHASINTKGDSTREQIETQTYRIPTFLDEVGLDHREIDVVRLDIEGHESAFLLDDFADLVDRVSKPFLLNIEIHPKYIEESRVRDILQFFEEEFVLVDGYQHSVRGELMATVAEYEDVLEKDLEWAELILRKK